MRRKIIPLVLFSGMVLLSSCAYYNTFYNAKKFYQVADKERIKRQRTQVVELSQEELAQIQRGNLDAVTSTQKPSSQELQNYEHAIERASKLIEFYPKSKYVDDAVMLLGNAFYHREDYSKALRKFEELLQFYPESPHVNRCRLMRAKSLIGLKEFDEAEQHLLEFSNDQKMKKNLREEATYELAVLYYEKRDYERAAENFQSTASEADDKLIRALSLYRLGECQIFLKNYQEAPNIFRRAVRIAPNEDFRSQATFKLGEAQSLVGDYADAIRTFSTLLSREYEIKRIPRIKLELANNLRKNNQLAEALKWYKNLIEEHKRTDASARANYALGEIEEFINLDYRKAKENYDLVRAEFASSLIVPEAKLRSDNIATLLKLSDEIAKLEGHTVVQDSTQQGGNTDGQVKNERDDAPINLSPDGMWVNYSGRDRPPPKSLVDLSEADLARASAEKQRQTLMAPADGKTEAAQQSVVLDSVQMAEQKRQAELAKLKQLSEKKLALAEVLLLFFNKTDSALSLYQQVSEQRMDSLMTARALYSLGYVHRAIKQDTVASNTFFKELLDLYPDTDQAEGARKLLGLPLTKVAVDSAALLFRQAERYYWDIGNPINALRTYDKLIDRFPTSPYAQKALYARGWLFENALVIPEEALQIYKQISEKYSDSPFSKAVKPKITAVEKARQEEEAKKKAAADSLAKKAAAKQDTTASDSTQTLQPSNGTGQTDPNAEIKAESEEEEIDRQERESIERARQEKAAQEAAQEGTNPDQPSQTTPNKPDSTQKPPNSTQKELKGAP